MNLQRLPAAFGLILLHAACAAAQTAQPADDGSALRDAPPSVTLFQNVRIFDGKGEKLSAPSHVLVRGNTIERISAQPIPTDRRADTVIIDGGGRTLMPGLIDNHWHALLVRPTVAEVAAGDIGYLNVLATAEAKDTLMRGFTTV